MLRSMVTAVACVIGVASSANAQSVSNGSFEYASVDPGSTFVELYATDNSILDWTVDSGSIDYIGGYWPAQDGSRSVDLSGNSIGSISQDILGTVAGQMYTVTFWASKNPDGGDALRTGTVSFGGTPMTFAYSDSNNLADMMWAQYSYNFLATGTTSTLSFAADATGGCCYGPALDNVSLTTAVPEPATWTMMLFGFGAVGFSLRRKMRPSFAQLA